MKVIGNVKFLPAGITQYVVDGNDGEINVDTSVSAVTIILPNIFNSGYENSDKGFVINDYSGNAGTNNITIVASNNTVNSQSSVVVSVNGGTAKCSIAGLNEWFVITEPSTSGMSGLLTPNYIPKAATSSTLNDSVIYQNGTKIGIGTTNPLTNLHVSGTDASAGIISARYSSDINAPGFAGLKARGTQSSPSAILAGDLMLTVSSFGYNSGGAFSAAAGKMVFYAKENFTASANGTAFKLSTTPLGATVDVFNFGINENGDVSIGDPALSSTARLYVKGIAATSATYAVKVDDSASSPLLYVRNDGNVGINKATPLYKLDIAGSAESYITRISDGGTDFGIGVFSSAAVFGTITANDLGIVTGNSQRMTVLASNGYVGFSTVSPTATAHVKGIDATSSNYALKVDDSASGPLLYVRNDGKVGVGIATPLLKFSVKPAANLDGIILQEDASNYYGHLGKDGTKGFLFLYDGNTAKVALNSPTYGTLDYINTGLNLAIGLNAGSAKVHIYGSDATSSNYALKVDNSAFNPILYARNDGITAVGTSSPTGSVVLEVNGAIGSSRATLIDPTSTANKNSSTGLNLNPNVLNNNGFSMGLGSAVSGQYPIWFSTGEVNGGGYDFYIGTTKKMSLDLNGDFLLGATTSNAKLNVKGTNTTAGTNAVEITNSTATVLFQVANSGKLTAPALQTGNAGLSTGDMYVDSAAQILANGDKVVGWKV